MIRANSIGAFAETMTGKTFTGELAGWLVGIFVLIISLIIGFWSPIISLIILAVTLIISPILSYLSLRY